MLFAKFLKSNPLSEPPKKIVSTLFPKASRAAMVVSGMVEAESL